MDSQKERFSAKDMINCKRWKFVRFGNEYRFGPVPKFCHTALMSDFISYAKPDAAGLCTTFTEKGSICFTINSGSFSYGVGWTHKEERELSKLIGIPYIKNKDYIIVIHKPTGIGYALGRDYFVSSEFVNPMYYNGQYILQLEEKWRPLEDFQQPSWAFGKPNKDFCSVWLPMPEENNPVGTIAITKNFDGSLKVEKREE